jgi:HTH-type transcriptional regulator/antitoxin HigA
MDKQIQNEYMPDYVSPPGETLSETIEAIGMTQADLAARTGKTRKTINEVIKGKAAITPETALQLERVLGVKASFWNNRERHYREFLARRAEQKRLQKQVGWLKEMPIKAMIEFGWIRHFNNMVQQLQEVLNFFGVASPEQWQNLWCCDSSVDFRKSPAFQSDPGAVAAWLRKGELVAQSIDCAPYKEAKFREALLHIRSLTIEPVKVFQQRLIESCAEAGVAVALVPQLPKTRASGATRWLSPNKALIQLSLRYKTDDHFWFTFFHEAGHIVLHGKRDVFLEYPKEDGEKGSDSKEEEANKFAAEMLISPAELQRFLQTRDYRSRVGIRRFATEIGIAAGIVVGRLQHDGHLPYSHCNDLKRRFEWAD